MSNNSDVKLRAVGYNRVSTDELVQLDALQVQIKETQECVTKMGWVMVDQYIDEGKSGTQTKKRNEYNRLYNDLYTNNFDVVVIKSQDRLMRNTKDWYIFIDALVQNHKRLYMYLENKFYTPDDALITGVKAILAEEFSRDMSKKQNNAHKRRQQLGTNAIITSSTWGYDKNNKTKEITINDKESEIIRLIFNLCLQGFGSRSIAKELANKGIYSRSGKQFAEVTVRKIIRNPLYTGTVVMNKCHKDFNTKQIIRNPESEWIYHENMIPAIISKDTWEKANDLMDKRSTLVKSDKFSKRRVGLNLGKYDLSGKIICGMCHSTYWRKYRNVKKGQVVDWYCSEYIKSGRKNRKANDTRGLNLIKIMSDKGCDNRHLKNDDLMEILTKVSDDIFENRKELIINEAMNVLKEVLGESNSIEVREELVSNKSKYISQKNLLMDKLLDGTISDSDFKMRNSDLDKRLSFIETRLIDIEESYNFAHNIDLRLHDIREALENKDSLTQEAKTLKLIQHIDKIVVYEDYLEIYFDFLQNIKIGDKYKDKKYQYVVTSVYSILQTDTYHHKGNYSCTVNIYV